MKTRARNLGLCVPLWFGAVAGVTYFVDWTAKAFDLSDTAEIVIAGLGAFSFGMVIGYGYIMLEERRKARLRREEQARFLESDERFSQWLRDNRGLR